MKSIKDGIRKAAIVTTVTAGVLASSISGALAKECTILNWFCAGDAGGMIHEACTAQERGDFATFEDMENRLGKTIHCPTDRYGNSTMAAPRRMGEGYAPGRQALDQYDYQRDRIRLRDGSVALPVGEYMMSGSYNASTRQQVMRLDLNICRDEGKHTVCTPGTVSLDCAVTSRDVTYSRRTGEYRMTKQAIRQCVDQKLVR